MSDGSIEIRDLVTQQELDACVALQRETWGADFNDVVPPSLMRVSRKVGGVAAGAFVSGELVGFVFGISGVDTDGTPVHWSDLLAVRHSHRDMGIGAALKHYQRSKLLSLGIRRMYWSFDPLVAKNAYVNFNRLGIYAREYVLDMYGDSNSTLHEGIGTDRLIAVWDMDRERPPAVEHARVEVPADIHGLLRQDAKAARAWREQTRAQFQQLLPAHVVTGFVRGETSYYVLTLSSSFET